MHAIRLNPIGIEAYGGVIVWRRTAKGIKATIRTAWERELSAAVQHRMGV
jgi:hypothetical protein